MKKLGSCYSTTTVASRHSYLTTCITPLREKLDSHLRNVSFLPVQYGKVRLDSGCSWNNGGNYTAWLHDIWELSSKQEPCLVKRSSSVIGFNGRPGSWLYTIFHDQILVMPPKNVKVCSNRNNWSRKLRWSRTLQRNFSGRKFTRLWGNTCCRCVWSTLL